MMDRCRFTLLIEYDNDAELIEVIAKIGKRLPDYDYASRPFPKISGGGYFKFLAFKELKNVLTFPKFARKALNLEVRSRNVALTPGYVSQTAAVTASFSNTSGALMVDKDLWLKVQLVHSGKLLVAHSLTDELIKDKRAVIYLNDVWQLVKAQIQ